MKYSLLLTLFAMLLGYQSFSQNYMLYGDRSYGGRITEIDLKLLKYGENKLVISGRSNTINPSGDKLDPSCPNSIANGSDIWTVMFDTSWNILWDVSLGGTKHEMGLSSILRLNNNQILISTHSNSDSSCEKSSNCIGFPNPFYNYWLCAIDSTGTVLWDQTIGAPQGEENPVVIQLSDNALVIAGVSDAAIGGDKTVLNYGGRDYWVVKLDSSGNKLWDNVYGGTGNEASTALFNMEGLWLQECDSGSFLLAGRTDSPVSGNISDPSFGFYDIWIIKIDSSGNKIWDKRYGGSSGFDVISQIIDVKTGGYILVGTTDSPAGGSVTDSVIGGDDVWVIRIDELGNKIWDRRYGGTDEDSGISIAAALEGGYWISAYTRSPAGNDISEPSYGNSDYWMLKIDSLGNKLWDKRFGGPGNDYASNFVIMEDSSIFLCGTSAFGSSAVKTDPGKGADDYWVVHFEYSDNIVGLNPIETMSSPFSLSPNPLVSDELFISSRIEGKASVSICDLLGREIFNEELILQQKNKFQLPQILSGLYLVNIKTTSYSETIKFIKM